MGEVPRHLCEPVFKSGEVYQPLCLPEYTYGTFASPAWLLCVWRCLHQPHVPVHSHPKPLPPLLLSNLLSTKLTAGFPFTLYILFISLRKPSQSIHIKRKIQEGGGMPLPFPFTGFFWLGFLGPLFTLAEPLFPRLNRNVAWKEAFLKAFETVKFHV